MAEQSAGGGNPSVPSWQCIHCQIQMNNLPEGFDKGKCLSCGKKQVPSDGNEVPKKSFCKKCKAELATPTCLVCDTIQGDFPPIKAPVQESNEQSSGGGADETLHKTPPLPDPNTRMPGDGNLNTSSNVNSGDDLSQIGYPGDDLSPAGHPGGYPGQSNDSMHRTRKRPILDLNDENSSRKKASPLQVSSNSFSKLPDLALSDTGSVPKKFDHSSNNSQSHHPGQVSGGEKVGNDSQSNLQGGPNTADSSTRNCNPSPKTGSPNTSDLGIGGLNTGSRGPSIGGANTGIDGSNTATGDLGTGGLGTGSLGTGGPGTGGGPINDINKNVIVYFYKTMPLIHFCDLTTE